MTWKTLILGGVATLALTATAYAAQPPVAVEGGRLAEAGGHRMELVTKGGKLDVLMFDQDNKPLASAGTAGKASVLAPSGKVDVTLQPVAPNRLSTALPAGAELAAAIVMLQHEGHSMNARFPALAQPASIDPAQVAEGAKLFADNCAACHGDKLQGQPNWQVRGADGLMPAPPLNEAGHAWHHSDQAMFDVIKKGGTAMAAPGTPSGMPPFDSNLKDPQIKAVIAYVKSTWPVATLAQQPAGQPAPAKALSAMPQGHPAATPAAAPMEHSSHSMPSGQSMPGMSHSGH